MHVLNGLSSSGSCGCRTRVHYHALALHGDEYDEHISRHDGRHRALGTLVGRVQSGWRQMAVS